MYTRLCLIECSFLDATTCVFLLPVLLGVFEILLVVCRLQEVAFNDPNDTHTCSLTGQLSGEGVKESGLGQREGQKGDDGRRVKETKI